MSSLETFAEIVRGDLEHIKSENARLMREHGVADRDVQKAAKELARKHGVDPKFVEFWSIYDYGFNGYVDLMFNITDPAHKNYKSSVHYKWLPKDRRGV